MSRGFGQYDGGTATGGIAMRLGIYKVEIKEANVKRTQAGTPVIDQRTSKAKFKLVVDVVGPRHRGVTVKKTMLIAFGQNSENGKWAQFATFIEKATGIPCGDPRQKEVDEPDLLGHHIWVVIKHERGYNNIDDFVEPEEAEPEASDARPPYKRVEDEVRHSAAPEQARATTATPATTTSRSTTTSISAGKQRQIDALAKAKHVTDTQVAQLVEKMTRGRTRFVADLTLDEADAVVDALKGAAA